MRRAGWLGVTLTVLLGASAANAAPRATSGTAVRLPLAHAGRWITDAGGRVVILHGTNMVYKIAPYYPQAVGFNDADAAFLARIGFNAVRVGVIWKALEPTPGVYSDAYLSHIASTVRTLARHGIVSLLDFHQDQYNELFQGEGFPDWSVEDDGLPPYPQFGFSEDYLFMPALQRAFDNFWANSPGPGGVGLEDRYAAAWRHVAQRFRGVKSVLGYEIMNEPFPGSTWQSCVSLTGCPVFDGMLTAFYKKVFAAIRGVDRRTLIWYEPNIIFDFGAGTALGPIGDHRAGFAYHNYCFEQGATGSTNSCAGLANLTISNALARVHQTGDALLNDEFGDPNYSLMAAMVQRNDQNMVPWMEWSFCPCHDPTGAASKTALVENPAKPPQGANLNLPGLRIFVEPYPQLISGTPLSWGFNSVSKTFTLRYNTARASGRGRFGAGAVTVVAAPALVYAGRYSVRATGAAVLSRRGASVLALAACRRAKTISVTVSPSRRWRARGSCRPPAPARAGPRRGSR